MTGGNSQLWTEQHSVPRALSLLVYQQIEHKTNELSGSRAEVKRNYCRKRCYPKARSEKCQQANSPPRCANSKTCSLFPNQRPLFSDSFPLRKSSYVILRNCQTQHTFFHVKIYNNILVCRYGPTNTTTKGLLVVFFQRTFFSLLFVVDIYHFLFIFFNIT